MYETLSVPTQKILVYHRTAMSFTPCISLSRNNKILETRLLEISMYTELTIFGLEGTIISPCNLYHGYFSPHDKENHITYHQLIFENTQFTWFIQNAIHVT